MLRGLHRSPALPETFLFGVATADHQVEAYVPDVEDIRDVWERDRKLTPRGRATDFWNRYAEDIELARGLGCTLFRFSIAWSRVEPRPGMYDDAAFAHYGRLIAAIRAAGMEPMVTLHHFTWPVHVQRRGGMIADDFPQVFARYVAEVVNRLGKDIRYWVTFNEPTQLVYGYVKPWWDPNYPVPPGLPEGATLAGQMDAVERLIRNLFVAHTAARRIIKRANPAAMVGANPLLLGLPPLLQKLVDWNATRIRRPEDLVAQGRRFAERAVLDRGEVDLVVATMTKTPERERVVAFSEVYYVAGQRLLVPGASVARDAADLVGKTIAVVKGSTAAERLEELVPRGTAKVVGDYPAALDALDRGQADALLADDTILRGLMLQHADRYKVIGMLLTEEPYAAAVAPGQRELLDIVDVAVRSFKESGAWAESYARHLGTPVPAPPRTTERSLAYLSGDSPVPVRSTGLSAAQQLAPRGSTLRRAQDRGYLIAAVKAEVPGFGEQDPRTGEWRGLEIDLARAVAQHIFGDPSKVEFRPVTPQKRIGLVRSALRWLDPFLKTFSVFSTALTSNWWHLGMAGKLPEFLCPSWCVGEQDYVGLDYYWGIPILRIDRVQALVEAAAGRFSKAPVWPAVLYSMLRYHAGLFPGMPIMIVENGSVDVADRIDRVSYLRRHIREVQRAVRDGAPVVAYVCWSITSNREWGLAFGPDSDFGLHHVALDTDPDLKRVPTAAAAAYRAIILERKT